MMAYTVLRCDSALKWAEPTGGTPNRATKVSEEAGSICILHRAHATMTPKNPDNFSEQRNDLEHLYELRGQTNLCVQGRLDSRCLP